MMHRVIVLSVHLTLLLIFQTYAININNEQVTDVSTKPNISLTKSIKHRQQNFSRYDEHAARKMKEKLLAKHRKKRNLQANKENINGGAPGGQEKPNGGGNNKNEVATLHPSMLPSSIPTTKNPTKSPTRFPVASNPPTKAPVVVDDGSLSMPPSYVVKAKSLGLSFSLYFKGGPPSIEEFLSGKEDAMLQAVADTTSSLLCQYWTNLRIYLVNDNLDRPQDANLMCQYQNENVVADDESVYKDDEYDDDYSDDGGGGTGLAPQRTTTILHEHHSTSNNGRRRHRRKLGTLTFEELDHNPIDSVNVTQINSNTGQIWFAFRVLYRIVSLQSGEDVDSVRTEFQNIIDMNISNGMFKTTLQKVANEQSQRVSRFSITGMENTVNVDDSYDDDDDDDDDNDVIASGGQSSSYQHLDPLPLHPLRVAGVILLCFTVSFVTVVFGLAAHRKEEREREIERMKHEMGGLNTEEGVNEILDVGRTAHHHQRVTIGEGTLS